VIVVCKQGTQCESLDLVLRTALGSEGWEIILSGAQSNGGQGGKIGEIKFLEDLGEALERMDELQPNIILVSLSDDDQEGLELLKEVKRRRPHVKLVVMADVFHWQLLRKFSWVDGLLLKGFTYSQFTNLISNLLKKNADTRPLKTKPDIDLPEKERKGKSIWIG
jgi:DNA-binding NarL/FixJ family response regulator